MSLKRRLKQRKRLYRYNIGGEKMFFRKKKRDRGPVPMGEVERMISSGMSDKDIIKDLKNRGYDSIERAMLQAVKQGVGEEKPSPKPASRAVPPAGDVSRDEYSTLEEVYGAEEEDNVPIERLPQELMPSQPVPRGLKPGPLQEKIPDEFAEDLPKPEIIVEELVEGVVEEKWQKFKQRLDRLEDEFESIKAGEKNLGEKIEMSEKESPQTREMEGKVSEISTQMEELEARIGGLEKAFRQFLPSLTTNIENLSDIIHQMKRKQGLEEEL
jgi:uncharacterized protein (UPF0335 family)